MTDLHVVNETTGEALDGSALATVSYDPASRSATWAFPGPLRDGNYRATLVAGSVDDAGNNLLWNDLDVTFFALAGDANSDRVVDVSDLGILATNWQGSAKTFSQGDFNYDGAVDVTDLGYLATNWQKSLSAPALRMNLPVATAARSAMAGPKRGADRLLDLI
jgi:hypothetical protein